MSGGRTGHVRQGSRNVIRNRRYGCNRRRRILRSVTRRRLSHGRHLVNVIRHRITRSNERTRKKEQIRRPTNGPTNLTSQDTRRRMKTKTRTRNDAPLRNTLTHNEHDKWKRKRHEKREDNTKQQDTRTEMDTPKR